MRQSFFGGLLIFIVCPTMPLAHTVHDDPQRRQIILPFILSATNCIAREALSEPGIAYAAREGRLLAALTGPIKRCDYEVDQMIEKHDRVYYPGSGDTFYKGPYLNDLPRAVTRRVGPELTRRAIAEDAQRAAAQAETDRRRAEDERRVVEIRAETERREAERKIQAERAESDRRAEQLRQAEIRRQDVNNASRASDLLKDRMYDCAAKEISGLVRSGEGADVLASAAMTLCSSEVDKALDSLIELKKIETGSEIGSAEIGAVKVAGRAVIRERVMAEAVKAKAARAPSTSN